MSSSNHSYRGSGDGVRALQPGRPGNGHVYGIAATASLGGLITGAATGVLSGAILYLRQEFNLDATLQEVGISIALIGAVIGALSASYLNEKLGRKKALLVATIVFLIGTLLTTFSATYTYFLISRLIVGLGFGVLASVVPVYLSEIAPSSLRGVIGSFNQLAIALGIALAYGADLFFASLSLGWRPMILSTAIPGALLLIGLQYIPESPRWLGGRERWREVEESLGKLGRTQEEAEDELANIREASETEAQHEGNRWQELFRPGIRVALLVGVGLALIQQFIGLNTVIYYSPIIFQVAGFRTANVAILATFSIGIVNVLTTVVACLLIDRVGRRPLLLWGTVGVVISLVALGAIFIANATNSGFWTLIALFVYIISTAISYGPVFWVMSAEIFPNNVRALGSSICTFFNWAANFTVSATFLSLSLALSIGGTFWLYGVVGVLAFFFCWFLVPETRGRSLEDIEYYWSHQRHWPGELPLHAEAG